MFNVLISNTDDHLCNHGFLYDGPMGWRLSPAYDMNPVPVDVKPRILSTAIMPDDPSASLDLTCEAAEYFGVSKHDARLVAAEVAEAVSRHQNELPPGLAREMARDYVGIEKMHTAQMLAPAGVAVAHG